MPTLRPQPHPVCSSCLSKAESSFWAFLELWVRATFPQSSHYSSHSFPIVSLFTPLALLFSPRPPPPSHLHSPGPSTVLRSQSPVCEPSLRVGDRLRRDSLHMGIGATIWWHGWTPPPAALRPPGSGDALILGPRWQKGALSLGKLRACICGAGNCYLSCLSACPGRVGPFMARLWSKEQHHSLLGGPGSQRVQLCHTYTLTHIQCNDTLTQTPTLAQQLMHIMEQMAPEWSSLE